MGNFDNTPLIRKILELREEEARMLGFDCYAEVSLTTKMASTPQQVLDFLGELAAKARPYAERDLAELREFAATHELGLEKLDAWDVAYASEKLRVDRYAFSDQEVKQYFPETSVLPGMFKLVENLYGIIIKRMEENVQLWHPDVKFFTINDGDGKLIGHFYLDLYARPGKRGGGWMDDAVSRRMRTAGTGESGIQAPVAYLNCNFSRPFILTAKRAPLCLPMTKSSPFFMNLVMVSTICSLRWKIWGYQVFMEWNGMRWNCPVSSWRTSAGNGKWSAI